MIHPPPETPGMWRWHCWPPAWIQIQECSRFRPNGASLTTSSINPGSQMESRVCWDVRAAGILRRGGDSPRGSSDPINSAPKGTLGLLPTHFSGKEGLTSSYSTWIWDVGTSHHPSSDASEPKTLFQLGAAAKPKIPWNFGHF